MLLSEAIQKYLVACRVEGKTIMTREGYTRNLSSFLEMTGDIEVKEIYSDIIESHIAMMMERKFFGHSLSSDTILKRYSVLRSFMHYLERKHYIDFNPMSGMKPPKLEQKLPRLLSDEQIIRMMNNLKELPRDRTILVCFLTTGCRLSEVSNLTIDDLNFDQSYIKVKGKGRKEGIVPMSDQLKDELYIYIQRYRDPKDPREKRLFLSDERTALTQDGMQIMVRRALWNVGVREKAGPHILRHTFATRYLRKGGNLEVLRKILRHVSITTTMIYTHLNQEDVRDDYLKTDAMSDLLRRRRKL